MRYGLFAFLLAFAPLRAEAAHRYESLALSFDGMMVAAVESSNASAHGSIVLRRVSDGQISRTLDPCATCTYSDLAFAPGGGLIFLSRDRAANHVSLQFANPTGTARTIATINGVAQSPLIAPDGRHVALLVTLNAAKEVGATQAGVRQIGEIGQANDEQRIAIFDLAGSVGAALVRPVSPPGRYVYEYAWTPDSRGFVASTVLGNGDNNWWIATIDAIDAISGIVRPIARPRTQVRYPRISPDGKTIAYIGGLMSDYGSVGGDVWTVPVTGGAPVNRSAGIKATITSLDWLADGLYGASLSGAEASIIRFDPDKGVAPLWSKRATLAADDAKVVFSADGRFAATIVQDYEHAPAIFAGRVQALRQITHDNDTLPALVSARSITWSRGGFDIQGWLLAPAGVNPSARAPLIVVVHGGPSAASTPTYVAPDSSTADLAKAGYYIFLPNPRGSYGQGEAFTAANKRDFGGGDLQDVLAGIDAVEKVAPVDDARLGMMGGSYGGFMTMWTNTQTNRFKALVAGAGLSNWISYYGTNGIDQWMIPFFGKSVYDDSKAYWDVSAINFIKRARTPTFIYVGERDIEVPPTQSIEYWHALKEVGVPTTLVIYPEEGHRLRNPANAADQRKRTIAWFDKYVKAGL